VTPDEWRGLFDMARGSSCDRWLLDSFRALSPLICREISWRAYGEADIRTDAVNDGGEALRREFFKLTDAAVAGVFEAWMIAGPDSAPRDFSYTKIMHYERAADISRSASFSEMLDSFYTRSQQLARIRQRASATSKTVKTAHSRIARKLAAQQAEIKITEGREYLRECGDIITANLHLMEKGRRVLVAQDFYSRDFHTIEGTTREGAPQETEKRGVPKREIALDPMKTPQQNAAKYYKDYTRAKNAEKYLSEQIKLGENELAYLESVLGEIALAENERDMAEIRRELVETGYIRNNRKEKGKQAESAPMRFESSAGLQILAGRNNSQNDRLTLKTARKSDVWLHTQRTHGSHVIISCGGEAPDDGSLLEAAAIAAYYSAARAGGKVPVDYTLVKHVKKPQNGRPGMVIYTDYKTIVAAPDEALVNKLKTENTQAGQY